MTIKDYELILNSRWQPVLSRSPMGFYYWPENENLWDKIRRTWLQLTREETFRPCKKSGW